MYTVSINNFKGCRTAKYNLNGLTILSGQGFSGKTSSGKAAAILASQLPKGSNGRSATETFKMNGGKASKIEIDGPDYKATIKYPACELTSTGQKIGDEFSSGLMNFLNLKKEDRQKELSEITMVKPLQKDLRKFLPSIIDDETVSMLWGKIEINGFEAMFDSANQKGKEYKAVWRHVTGTTFPTKGTKAAQQTLDGLKSYLKSEDKTETILGLKNDLTALAKNEGIQESVIAQKKTLAHSEKLIKKDIEKQETKLFVADEKIKMQESAIEGKESIDCYSCGTRNYIGIKKETINSLLKLKQEHTVIDSKLFILKKELQDSILAYEWLKKNENKKDTTEEQRVRINNEIHQAEEIDKMRELAEKAQAQFDLIEKNIAIQDALKPSGVRADCLVKSMKEFNIVLKKVSEEIGIDTVVLTDDSVFVVGDRKESDLSGSETWALRHTIQITIARFSVTPKVIFLDEVGELDERTRTGLINVIKEMIGEHYFILAITHYNKDAADKMISEGLLPDFDETDKISHYWVEDGILSN